MRSYNFVCRTSDDIWLEERHKRITGTEVGVILGNSKFKTRDELLAEKVNPFGPDEFRPTRNMLHGTFFETPNARLFSTITGARVRHAPVFLESRTNPEIGTSLDFLVRAPQCDDRSKADYVSGSWFPAFLAAFRRLRGLGILEMKNTEAWNKKEWESACPTYYHDQVQTQLFVLGLKWAVIAAKIGAADMRMHIIEADPFYHSHIVSEVRKFRQEIEDVRKQGYLPRRKAS